MCAYALLGFSIILTAFIGPTIPSAAADDPEPAGAYEDVSELLAELLAADAPELAGAYQCVGDDGTGKRYQGKVTISKEEDCINLTWEVAGVSFSGIGIREGNVLSAAIRGLSDVTYTGIIVYRIEKDGKLVGRWSGLGFKGKTYTETLTPENSPKPLNEVASAELDQLKGTWELESRVTDGSDGSEFALAKALQILVEIDGSMWTFFINGKAADTNTIVIGPGTEPKTIDRTSKEDQTTQLGIYKLDGDTLTVAFGAPNAKRPETFESPKGSRVSLSVYKRRR